MSPDDRTCHPSRRPRRRRGTLVVSGRQRAFAGALLVAGAGPCTLLADLPVATTLLWRGLLALPLLAWWKRGRGPLPPRAHLLGFGVGLTLLANIAAWHVAVLHLGLGPATLLSALRVVMTVLGGALVLDEQRAGVLVPLVGGTLGALLIAVDGGAAAPPLAGVLAGVGAALAGSMTLLLLGLCGDLEPAPEDVLPTATVTFTVGAVVAALATTAPLLPTSEAVPALLVLGVVVHAGGWHLLGRATADPALGAGGTAMATLVQPLVAVVIGIAWFGDTPTPPGHVGAALLVATIVHAQTRRPITAALPPPARPATPTPRRRFATLRPSESP